MTQDEATRSYFDNRMQGMQDYSEWPEFADHVRSLLDVEGADTNSEAYKRVEREHGSHSSLGVPRRLCCGDVRAILGNQAV